MKRKIIEIIKGLNTEYYTLFSVDNAENRINQRFDSINKKRYNKRGLDKYRHKLNAASYQLKQGE